MDTLKALASESYRLGQRDALTAVRREVEKRLYTNTKSGNRALMLNVLERVEAALATAQVAPVGSRLARHNQRTECGESCVLRDGSIRNRL